MFETTNTKLAAALITLGFELDRSTVFEGERIVLRIGDKLAMGYAPDDFQALWRDRIWQDHNPHHPFIHIVKVAEAREWLLNRVIYHYNSASERPMGETFNTDNLPLASCIVAEGFFMLFFEGRTFFFPKDAELVQVRFLDPDDVIRWQLQYLRELKHLLERIRNRHVLVKKRACHSGRPVLAFSHA